MRQMFILLLFSVSIFAGSCWKIKNNDQKALCESKYEGKKSCWLIKKKDLRAYCKASAYGQQSCWTIKNKDLKAMCEAECSYRGCKN